MDDIMNLSTRSTPGVPGCFDENTPIKMFDSSYKNIVDIEVGDTLCDNSIVTGIMKLSAAEQHIYKLKNIIVTGEHRVFYANKEWIKVKEHPESILINDFNKHYVYCLMTTTKTFIANANANANSCVGSGDEQVFSDWDDIDESVIEKLDKNCVPNGYIPSNFKMEDIHNYLDNGLHKDTKIKLKTGKEIPINKIRVNDILTGGERVVGTIKIDATKLIGGIHEYIFDNGKIRLSCSNNININNYLGGINTFNLYGNPILDESSSSSLYLYQLLTTTGSFNANGLMVGDYNTGIDRYIL